MNKPLSFGEFIYPGGRRSKPWKERTRKERLVEVIWFLNPITLPFALIALLVWLWYRFTIVVKIRNWLDEVPK